MKLHPGASRQVDSMVKKTSPKEQAGEMQQSGGSERQVQQEPWLGREYVEDLSERLVPGAPFFDLLRGALRASWRLGTCYNRKQHRTVV